jgi:integrase
LRRGEVLGLRWKDFDPQTGKLSICGQLIEYKDHSVEWVAPKTASSLRSVTLPPQTVGLLTALKRQAAEWRLRLGRGAGLGDAFMFTERNDRESPIRPDKLTVSFTRHCDRNALPDFTFHGTRHTHLTALLRSVGKAGAKAVSQRAGHSDITMTLRVYQTVFEEDDSQLASLAGDFLSTKNKS